MHLLNVETSIVPQIEDTIGEPTMSSEHEVGLITSYRLISILMIQQTVTHPSLQKHKPTDTIQDEVKELDNEEAPKISSEALHHIV